MLGNLRQLGNLIQVVGCSRRRNPKQGQPLGQQKPESTLIRLTNSTAFSECLGGYADVVSVQNLIPAARGAQATKQYKKISEYRIDLIDPLLTIAHSTNAFDLLTTGEGKLVLTSKKNLEVTFNEPEISASPIRAPFRTGESIYFNEGTTVKYDNPEATLIRTIETEFGHIIIEDSTPQVPHNPQTTTPPPITTPIVALSFIPITGKTFLVSRENVTDTRPVECRKIYLLQEGIWATTTTNHEGIWAITDHEGIRQQIETDNSFQVHIRITREGHIPEERTINISSQ